MTWKRTTVECVVCPDCCFTFSAEHYNTDTAVAAVGGSPANCEPEYSCPNCGYDDSCELTPKKVQPLEMPPLKGGAG